MGSASPKDDTDVGGGESSHEDIVIMVFGWRGAWKRMFKRSKVGIGKSCFSFGTLKEL